MLRRFSKLRGAAQLLYAGLLQRRPIGRGRGCHHGRRGYAGAGAVMGVGAGLQLGASFGVAKTVLGKAVVEHTHLCKSQLCCVRIRVARLNGRLRARLVLASLVRGWGTEAGGVERWPRIPIFVGHGLSREVSDGLPGWRPRQ